MKVRRIIVELEVPYTCTSKTALQIIQGAFVGAKIAHQAQVVKEGQSPNTRIGNAV